jgi:starvation-inducible DNA-binding protein
MNNNLIKVLETLLADSYTLYLKTQNFHWNVTGHNFKSLHSLFEEQYKDLASAIDEIAERIRMLGSKAPGSWKTYAELTTIKDSNKNADSISMIHDLIDGQELIIKTFKKTIDEAQKIKDEVTIDMAVTRIGIHEKNSWMLKSSI